MRLQPFNKIFDHAPRAFPPLVRHLAAFAAHLKHNVICSKLPPKPPLLPGNFLFFGVFLTSTDCTWVQFAGSGGKPFRVSATAL
jgi:hypothetical protein